MCMLPRQATRFGAGDEVGMEGGKFVFKSPSLLMVSCMSTMDAILGWRLVYPRFHCVSHCLTDKGASHGLGLGAKPCFIDAKSMRNEVNKFS